MAPQAAAARNSYHASLPERICGPALSDAPSMRCDRAPVHRALWPCPDTSGSLVSARVHGVPG